MAKWENKIDISNIIKEIEEKKIKVSDGAKKVAQYLRNFTIRPSDYKGDLDNIADEFENIKETDVDATEQFDDVLTMLYDLGDIDLGDMHGVIRHKLIWIETQG